jgi:hypothetical protein
LPDWHLCLLEGFSVYTRAVNRVPPHATGGSPLPEDAKVEQLEELGDDAIIAQQQSAHVPKPRAQVTEEARSIVISEHPAQNARSAPTQKLATVKRSSRNEKTVVIRDRRQVDELRRQMAQHRPSQKASHRGVLLWVVVGVVAFVTGGLVALFATKDDGAPPGASLPATSAAPTVSVAPPPPAPEPPKVSIDELPIEGHKKK